MSDDLVAQLRERAERLLALALKAREDGDAQLSEHIVAAALQCVEKAKAPEAAAAKPKEELAAVGQPRSRLRQIADFFTGK